MIRPQITYLPWDSEHFGFRIARAKVKQLTFDSCKQLQAACHGEAIDCLYFLADAADQDTVSILQDSHFDFVDIRHTLAGRICDIPSRQLPDGIGLRLGRDGDLAALLPIAGASYTLSRFYADRRFDRDKASLMYQVWLEKSLTTDFADAVVVAEMAGAPVGYVTCHLRRPACEANIGLVGMAESAMGLGCASAMLRYLGDWLSRQGFEQWKVVTQGRNIAGQRLYQRCGFATSAVDLWFHKWFR